VLQPTPLADKEFKLAPVVIYFDTLVAPFLKFCNRSDKKSEKWTERAALKMLGMWRACDVLFLYFNFNLK